MVGFYLYPIAKVLWISVAEPQPGLQNYERLFDSESVQRVLWVTARIGVTNHTRLALALGYVVAYAMVHAGERTLRWLTFLVLFPLWISVLVAASFAWVDAASQQRLVNQGLLRPRRDREPLALVATSSASRSAWSTT
jgi:putative spermidine/putrescine transport system permease protein